MTKAWTKPDAKAETKTGKIQTPHAKRKLWRAALPAALLIGAGVWFITAKNTPAEKVAIEEKTVDKEARYQCALSLFTQGEAKREAGDMKNAEKLYDRAAAEGDPEINAILIDRYMRAQDGFDYDFEKAESLIRNLPAQAQGRYLVKLARQHENGGRGLRPDIARAAGLLEDAVKIGYQPASMILYNFYSNPAHTPPFYDTEKAFTYIDKAIADTDAAAPRMLKAKALFAKEETREQAIPLLEEILKVERRNEIALEMIGEFYYARNQKGDRKKAMRYYNRLPTPLPEIIYRKAEMLREDAVTKMDWIEARDHYVIAATSRHIPSMMMMGHIHRLGLAGDPNPDVALSFYEAVPIYRGSIAGHYIGAIYEAGDPSNGGKPDYAKAITAYKNGIEADVPAATVMMARLYEKGLGVTKDDAKAFELMESAAKAGSNMGREGLADYYQRGIGTARNTTAASQWTDLIKTPEDTRIFICDICDPKTE